MATLAGQQLDVWKSTLVDVRVSHSDMRYFFESREQAFCFTMESDGVRIERLNALGNMVSMSFVRAENAQDIDDVIAALQRAKAELPKR